MSEKFVGGTVAKSIGPYFTAYVQSLLDSGRYSTVAEILREALRLHEKSIGNGQLSTQEEKTTAILRKPGLR